MRLGSLSNQAWVNNASGSRCFSVNAFEQEKILTNSTQKKKKQVVTNNGLGITKLHTSVVICLELNDTDIFC